MKDTTAFPYNIIRYIMKRYRTDDYKKWLADTTTHYAITFSDFIQYVIDTPNKKLNPHFRPMMNHCQPCTVKYDFYGAFKHYNDETKVLIDRLDTKEEYRHNEGDHVTYHIQKKSIDITRVIMWHITQNTLCTTAIIRCHKI